jgi:hypothetical protein
VVAVIQLTFSTTNIGPMLDSDFRVFNQRALTLPRTRNGSLSEGTVEKNLAPTMMKFKYSDADCATVLQPKNQVISRWFSPNSSFVAALGVL